MIRKCTIIVIAIFCVVLSACTDPVYYAPQYYGEHNRCYYVYDPAEVRALQNAGLCPRNWIPYPMPVAWHAMYYSYYSSPSYYDRYIPVKKRTYYRTVVVKKFEVEHRTEIKKYSSRTTTTKSKTTTKTTSKTTTKSTTSKTTIRVARAR